MDKNRNTRITLSEETKKKLDRIKLVCGKSYETIVNEMIAKYEKSGYVASFDDVISKLIDIYNKKEEEEE